jgi:hypothetical protein
MSWENPREIQALEQRIGMLEDQRSAWRAKSYETWLEKHRKIEAYDKQLHDLMKQHPELQEAWDSVVCLYTLAVGKNLLKEAVEKKHEGGCYLCWSDNQIVQHESEDRESRRAG